MYEILIRLKDTSAALANKYLQKDDEYMFIFWSNCSREYERRANELTIEEAV